MSTTGYSESHYLADFGNNPLASCIKGEATLKGTHSLLSPYAVALLAVSSALLLTLLLQPLLKPTIFLLFFAGVAVSASYGGMEAGLMASALSTLAVSYFFLEPVFSFSVANLDSIRRLGLFVLVTTFISLLNSELRTAKQHLQISLQKLQVSEAKLTRLVESNIIGVIVANMDGAMPTAGYGYAELKTKGVCQPFENEYIRKDETCVPILSGSALLENNSNDIISFVLDLSEQQAALRKQAEQERKQLLEREQAARADAEAANRMKDEFLATLSHELRTPLNTILGWTQLLRSRKFDETTTARALETIERNTRSLAQLIEDVLDVSRVIRGTLYLSMHRIKLVPLVEAAIDTVRPAAEAKEISINCRFDPEVGVVVGDTHRLQQVVWNLLSNAVKFTSKGGRVDVQLERIESSVQIRVSDTGVGIADEFLPHVFERFRQADSSITRSHGGLGLGLAIVRHLVELHGGTVSVESPGIGEGATFIVNLPMKAVYVEANTAEQLSSLVDIQEANNYLPRLDDLRVLIVDDEPDARQLLTTILEQYGAQVIAVASASDAMIALQKVCPHIMVSDIGMPQEDGYALIRQVRALPANRGGRIPVVALTAYAKAEDRTQALLAGFQLHVPKPVNPAELAAVVANLTGRT